MGFEIVQELAGDVGNFLTKLCTPNDVYRKDNTLRKVSLGIGTVGVTCAIALKLFGSISTAACTTLGAFSASLMVGGITAIPLFTLIPVISFAAMIAVNIDYSNIVFVYHLN